MCGRYHVESEEDIIEMREIINEINRKYKDTAALAAMKTGEVFPTNLAPVIAQSGPEIMKWGFPMQGKSQTIINARSETAHERAMFRTALMTRRLAIPTTGFYEWTHEGKKSKDKFLFRLPMSDMLYLAGFYTEFNMPTGKEARFTILTTAANDSLAAYHDRMPVYIGRSECDAWIRDQAAVKDFLSRPQPALVASKIEKASQLGMFE